LPDQPVTIELIRQFYDEERSFRITAPNGVGGISFMVFPTRACKISRRHGRQRQPLYRRPIFDLKIKAHKKNPFSRMEQNETAKELYKMGFFNPERAQEALMCLDMMEFEVWSRSRKGAAGTNAAEHRHPAHAGKRDA
jgi:ribosomal protein S16